MYIPGYTCKDIIKYICLYSIYWSIICIFFFFLPKYFSRFYTVKIKRQVDENCWLLYMYMFILYIYVIFDHSRPSHKCQSNTRCTYIHVYIKKKIYIIDKFRLTISVKTVL